MKFSIATKDITPQKPVFLSGFAARKHQSEGVLDPVYMKMLLMQADKTLLFITLDVTAGDDNFVKGIKSSLHTAFGLEHHQILINFSHTHHSVKVQGPAELGPRLRPYSMAQLDWAEREEDLDYSEDDAFYSYIRDSLLQMVRDGLTNMQEGNLWMAKGQSDFAVSRRLPNRQGIAEWKPNYAAHIDRDLFVYKITDAQDEIKGIIYAYGCHPTTMGPNNNLISNDYIGEAARVIERKYTQATALFLQGCAAELKPRHSAAGNRFIKCDPAQMKEAGRYFARDIDSTLTSEDFEKLECQFTSAVREPELPIEYKTLDFWQDVLNSDQPPHRKLSAKRHIRNLETARKKQTFRQYIQVFQLSREAIILALRDEIPTDYALLLKEKLGNGKMAVLGYSNGEETYIPTRKMIEGEGGYEVETPISTLGGAFKPEVEDLIVSCAKEVVEECRTA